MQKEKINFLDPSLIFLILANLTTLILAVLENWSIETLLWIYWYQSLIIGFFYIIKIATAKIQGPILKPTKKQIKNMTSDELYLGRFLNTLNRTEISPARHKIETIATFVLFFGAIYAAFYYILTHKIFSIDSGISIYQANSFFLLSAIGVFFLNHLFSFIYNFIIKKERNFTQKTLGGLAVQPIIRTVPFILSIVFVPIPILILTFLGVSDPQGISFFIVIFLIKIPLDALMHIQEHRKIIVQ